jgi:hypothetical protein
MAPAGQEHFYRSTQRINPVLGVMDARGTVIERIKAFFERNRGQKFCSLPLHNSFGTSFRTRVSDINTKPEHSDYRFTIKNDTFFDGRRERSFYWSEPKEHLF